MRKERQQIKYFSSSLISHSSRTLGHLSHGEILDRFPWMRPIHPSRKILAELDKYLDEFQGIMRKELAKPFSDSYPQALSKVEIDGKALKETDIMGSLMEFCVAGIISTSFRYEFDRALWVNYDHVRSSKESGLLITFHITFYPLAYYFGLKLTEMSSTRLLLYQTINEERYSIFIE